MSRRFHIELNGDSRVNPPFLNKQKLLLITLIYLDSLSESANFHKHISKFPPISVPAQSTGTNLNWQSIARPWQTAAVRGRATRWHLWTLWGWGSSLTSGQGRLGASVSGAFFVKCWIVWWMEPLRWGYEASYDLFYTCKKHIWGYEPTYNWVTPSCDCCCMV